jgi:hypothetical protein
MQTIITILSGILHHTMIEHQTVLADMQVNMALKQDLMNSQFFIVVRFICEVLLVFIIGGIIGKLLNLDNVDRSDSHTHSRHKEKYSE